MKFPPTRQSLALAAVLIVCSLPIRARADDDDLATTNRDSRPIEELFLTDAVYPQQKGELELEVASVYRNNSSGDSWTIPLSAEYGLTSQWQVEAEWDSLVQRFRAHQSTVRGYGDLELGTQYSFMNVGGSTFHIAPRFSIGVPTGDVNRDLGDGFLEYEPALIVAKDFPELHRTQIFTELGAAFAQRVKTPRDSDNAEPAANELNWGVGGFMLFARGAATLEFNLFNNTWNHAGTENELYLTPGYLWRITPEIELGLGVPIGLNKDSDRFDVIAHVVWEF